MKQSTTLFILISFASVGFISLAENSVGTHDNVVGWFNISEPIVDGKGQTHDAAIIPVFKYDDIYYTPMLGFEAALDKTPEGLQWDGHTQGLTIGFNRTSNAHFVHVVRRARPNHPPSEWQACEEMHLLNRIDKPSWVIDTPAEAPNSQDDFLGWYQAMWLPIQQVKVWKDGDKYLFAWAGVGGTGQPEELTPFPDSLGFQVGREFTTNRTCEFIFNTNLSRFEILITDTTRRNEDKARSIPLRMPLTRVAQPSTVEPPPDKWIIGYPFIRD